MSTEKKPRLFYWEDAEDCWTPAEDLTVADIVSLDILGQDGQETSISFKRIDMTDEEFAAIPEEVVSAEKSETPQSVVRQIARKHSMGPVFKFKSWSEQDVVNAINERAGLVRLRLQLNAANQDVIDAAGALLVDIPEPGTPMAKVMRANSAIRRERDAANLALDNLRDAANDDGVEMQNKLNAANLALTDATTECRELKRLNAEYYDQIQTANRCAERMEKALKALYKAADEVCERADFNLIDSGQWRDLGRATDDAMIALAQAQASGEGK